MELLVKSFRGIQNAEVSKMLNQDLVKEINGSLSSTEMGEF